MMRGPPGLPETMNSWPSRSTIVGVILESGSLAGCDEIRPASIDQPVAIRRALFRSAKSSISLFRITPVPGTVIPEPNGVLIVIVSATARPDAESVTERWVVPASSGIPPGAAIKVAVSVIDPGCVERCA